MILRKQILFIFLIVFLSIVNSEKIFGQKKIQTALELSKNNKFRYIKSGRKARIHINNQKYKVWIDSISPDKIFTKDTAFEIDKIDKIAIRYRGTMISGSIIGTAGLLFTGVGTAMIIQGFKSNDLGGVFAVIIGLAIDIIGVPVAGIGASVFFIGKKYKKNKGWKFKAVQIE